LRFQGVAYRGHDPRWSFRPLSGDGAAIHGGRFNPRRVPALYLALDLVTAVNEANQGFARKIDPLVLCSYEIDCEDIVDLRTPANQAAEGVTPAEIACGWMLIAKAGREPPTWALASRLIGRGAAGVLVPSFAPGAAAPAANLVLWTWTDRRPHRCWVHDPSGRLPRDQLSWPVRP
jgi:RES domain-containing protein